jgi:hypothetical protein
VTGPALVVADWAEAQLGHGSLLPLCVCVCARFAFIYFSFYCYISISIYYSFTKLLKQFLKQYYYLS